MLFRSTWLTDFFFGHAGQPGLQDLAADLGSIDAQQINTMKVNNEIEIRVGRYGAYLQQGQGEERKFANIPEGMAPDELTLTKAIELLAAPSGERELGIDPSTNLPVIAKSGRYGPYITEVLPEVEGKKKNKKAGAAVNFIHSPFCFSYSHDNGHYCNQHQHINLPFNAPGINYFLPVNKVTMLWNKKVYLFHNHIIPLKARHILWTWLLQCQYALKENITQQISKYIPHIYQDQIL